LLLYTLSGFFLVPFVIKQQMLKRLPALTKRNAAVRQVKLNPYALSLTIRGLSLTESNGEEFVGFDELYVNLQLSSLLKRGFVFKEISVKKPSARVVYMADGTFNFSNLLSVAATDSPKPSADPSPARELPLVIIEQLRVSDGAVTFTDLNRKVPFKKRFGPINVQLAHFTTRPEAGSPYSVVASTDDGETFAWSGNISISPPSSSGTFKLSGLHLAKYVPYVQDYARIHITSGSIDVQADYRVAYSNGTLDAEISKAGLDLHGLRVQAVDSGETIVNLAELSVKEAEASLARRTARVGAIASSKGFFGAKVNADGTVNVVSLLVARPDAKSQEEERVQPSQTSAPEPSAAWQCRLDDLKLRDYSVEVENLERLTKPLF
jgi:hypothetical protein